MEEGVVLNSGDREFKDIPNKIRHDGAAAAVLRIKMGDIRNRHVEGKLKGIIPFGLAVKYRGPEALSAIFAPITIDDFRPPQEFFLAIEEPAVVVQVLDYKLTSTVSD